MQANLVDARLGLTIGDLPHFVVLTCPTCDSHVAGPTFYSRSRSGRSLRLRDQPKGIPQGDTLGRVLREASIRFDVEAEPSFDGPFHQWGGEPLWLGDAVEIDCPSCTREMTFITQVDTDSEAGLCFADRGMLYAFACVDCAEFATIVQTA